jgi:hypothetical protein
VNISRRYLLLSGTALSVAACATTVTPTTIATGASQLATDAGLIVSGLQAVIAMIPSTAGFATTLATLNADLTSAENFANTVASAASPPATSTVQEIVNVLEGAAPILLGLIPGAASIAGIVQAILSLTPTLLSDVGSVGLAMASASRQTARAATKSLPMIPAEQARLILRGVQK